MHGARFRQNFGLEDAILISHACSLEASKRVTNAVPLGCSILLPVDTVYCVLTLKAKELRFQEKLHQLSLHQHQQHAQQQHEQLRQQLAGRKPVGVKEGLSALRELSLKRDVARQHSADGCSTAGMPTSATVHPSMADLSLDNMILHNGSGGGGGGGGSGGGGGGFNPNNTMGAASEGGGFNPNNTVGAAFLGGGFNPNSTMASGFNPNSTLGAASIHSIHTVHTLSGKDPLNETVRSMANKHAIAASLTHYDGSSSNNVEVGNGAFVDWDTNDADKLGTVTLGNGGVAVVAPVGHFPLGTTDV
jgi:hypothetical protein